MSEELDLIDRKIIYNLDFDSRMPLTQLAKKVGISKQVAKYRIENLVKRGIIMGFYADINASKIGLEIYMVYFKFHKMTPDIEKKFIKHMCSQESVGVNISVNGKWDYTIDLWAPSIMHFKRYYQNIMKDYEKYVKNKQVVIETDFYYFKPKLILDIKSDEQITMTGDIESIKLDEIDKKILAQLAKNARIPLVELAQIVDLTPNAVKERIKNLEKNNIILGYRVFINYQLLGFLHYRVFLHLENLTEEIERKIIQFLKYHKTCVSITKTIGYCELEFRPIVKDIDEFYKLMEELRNRFSDYLKEYESIIYYKMHDVWNYFPFSS
ncbi:MAG: Lrp/AsnC family transcriptional regulator [Nanoarchaeota archaeon]|nr:Lrp/AsnC family transcriptional regulator [Nanoarchaeota archaeon]